jgi:protein-L-isoaspartate(D-aspartate) O-methyltransferase
VTDDLLHRYATNVTAAVADPAIASAFRSVPRDLFVRQVVGSDGAAVTPSPEEVYSDAALVTHWRDGWPSSSSSQPSLMARMLAALDLRPGQRVLEIGAGTGYNAALIARITGGAVVSLDVQPEVVAEARAALERAGIEGVEVRVGDGYRGAPEDGPFDRIIATVGVGGIPPGWFDQMAPDGVALAPVEHGGMQPCLRAAPPTAAADPAAPTGAAPTGEAVTNSGFMLASGPLHPHGHPPEPVLLDPPPPVVPIPPVAGTRYYDLWFWLAVHDRRVGRRAVPGYPPHDSPCVVADPEEGLVLVQPDALRPVGASPGLLAHVRDLVDGWHAAGAPPAAGWRCGFRLADGLWLPTRWRLPG